MKITLLFSMFTFHLGWRNRLRSEPLGSYWKIVSRKNMQTFIRNVDFIYVVPLSSAPATVVVLSPPPLLVKYYHFVFIYIGSV